MSVTDALDIDPSPPHPLIPCSHPLCRCGVRKMTVTDSFLNVPPLPPPPPPCRYGVRKLTVTDSFRLNRSGHITRMRRSFKL